MDDMTINKVLKEHDITEYVLTFLHDNRRSKSYLVNDSLILSLSNDELGDLKKLDLLSNVPFTQKVLYRGQVVFDDSLIHYSIKNFIKGITLYESIPSLSKIKQEEIGRSLFECMISVHKIKDTFYDIGHYVPTIPRFDGSWKAGHIRYIKYLEKEVSTLKLTSEQRQIVDKSLTYMYTNIDVLTQEHGPVLLHNDLHPKNIIIHNDHLSGLIDWECAQYSEVDFDLSHIIAWSICQIEGVMPYQPLVQVLINEFQEVYKIENLATRITIYQLEHELNQIIWTKKLVDERLHLCLAWMNGLLEKTLSFD